MKPIEEIKYICEEYSEEVSVLSENDVSVLMEAKYFNDLQKRLYCYGWSAVSIKKKHFLIIAKFANFIL